MSSLWSRAPGRGLIQVGVNVARSRKKNSSESVRAAGRPGPADPVATTFLYTLCFHLLPRIPVPQKTIHFATQVRAIAVAVLIPTEILIAIHFFHPRSSWRRSLIFIQRYFLFATHSSRRCGSKRYGLTPSSVMQ